MSAAPASKQTKKTNNLLVECPILRIIQDCGAYLIDFAENRVRKVFQQSLHFAFFRWPVAGGRRTVSGVGLLAIRLCHAVRPRIDGTGATSGIDLGQFSHSPQPTADQWVTLPVRYNPNLPAKPAPGLCPRQHLRADARRSA